MQPEVLPQSLNGKSPVRVGLDIGGSSVKGVAGSGDDSSRVWCKQRMARPADDVVAGLAEAARSVAAGATILDVGVTVPGIVEDGVVRACTNVPQLVGINLSEELSAVLGVPVSVVNDGTAAALAEAKQGAGRGVDDVFVAVLGTGVAGAHVVNGLMQGGAHGQAGELGHLRVPESVEPCSCGSIGCLETVIGAPALQRSWALNGGVGGIEGLHEAWMREHAWARAVVENAAQALASGLLTLSALVDPQRVVIGGGVAEGVPEIVSEAARIAADRATFHRLPEVVSAEFGPWAGAVGSLLS